MELVYGIGEIYQAAEQLKKLIGDRKVVAFNGEMGAGKTTFIHALCSLLGVTGSVSSPTFSIINEYESPSGNIFHIDLYRCKDEEEAIRAGVEDCLYSGKLCLVEWPSIAKGIFPDDTVDIRMEAVDAQTRRMTIKE